MAYEHLILQSKLIEDEKVRNDYVNLPLLHRLLQENNNSDKLEKSAKQTSVDDSDDTPISIFLFCPECGFKNDNKFKFCPSCGGSLQP